MRSLEHFAEGEYRVGPLKITRKYIPIGCFPEDQKQGMGDKFTHYTRVENMEMSPVCQLGMVHGFCECSDGFLESAMQYALNGMLVHAVDIECHGYAAGVRVTGLRIDAFHFSVTAMIKQFDEGLQTFLYGNSMGCMVINTFLLKNPELKLAGVIFSAPFFGFSEKIKLTWFRTQILKLASPIIPVSTNQTNITFFCQLFCLQSPIKIHSVSINKPYMHSLLQDRKAIPFLNSESTLSLLAGTQNLQKHSKRFAYSYLLMMGEYDDVVSNTKAEDWHMSTPELEDKQRIMFPKMCH